MSYWSQLLKLSHRAAYLRPKEHTDPTGILLKYRFDAVGLVRPKMLHVQQAPSAAEAPVPQTTL